MKEEPGPSSAKYLADILLFFKTFRAIHTQRPHIIHGHLHEGKYVYVVKGSAIIIAVELDNIKTPSKNAKLHRFVLSDKKPQIIFIPPKYAHGFRPLEKDTRLIFFSTSTLEESKDDDYRFPADYWGKSIWEIENR